MNSLPDRQQTGDGLAHPASPRLKPTGPIVPSGNIAGFALMLVIAIMAFLACVTLGAVMMVRQTALAWQSEISREITIQVKPVEGLDMEAALVRVRQTVSQLPGIVSAEIVDTVATARLLEPWLGEAVDITELPVPRLVIVIIDEEAPPDFQMVKSTLSQAVPEAFLDDHRGWVDRLTAMARTTIIIGVSILALVLVATVLTVVFATRGALSGNRHIVEVLHFVGAESRFVASQFQTHFLLIGLKGAFAGGALSAILFAVAAFWQNQALATPGSDQATALFGRVFLGAAGYAGIALVIVAIAVLTGLTTRITVMRTIAEIDSARLEASRVRT